MHNNFSHHHYKFSRLKTTFHKNHSYLNVPVVDYQLNYDVFTIFLVLIL